MSLPVEVIEAVKQRKCVVFLGSRVSQEACEIAGKTFPTETSLAKKLGWQKPKAVIARSKKVKPSLEGAAKDFEKRAGRQALINELKGQVGAFDVSPSKAHELALKQFPIVFSTAWDDLLLRVGVDHKVQDLRDPVADPASVPLIVRVRGGFDDPDRLLITSDDFDSLDFTSAHRKAIRNILRTHEALFVGFRPDEEEFDRLWELITNAYGGELPKCHLAIPQGQMDDFLWQKWVWRGLLLFTADPLECLEQVEAGLIG